MYREEIMDHYKRPRNTGRLNGLEAEGENESCGDSVRVYLEVENGEVFEMKHETDACAICTAATSILSEKLPGTKTAELEEMDRDWMLDTLEMDISPMRVKCAVLGLETVKKALQ